MTNQANEAAIKAIEQQAGFALNLHAGNVKQAMSAAHAGSSDLWKVPRDQIKVIPGYNVRQESPDYLAHIENIANSMINEGYLPDQPMGGYVASEDGNNVIYITSGHSRLRAFDMAVAKGAQMKDIPVVVSKKGTDMEDLTVALIQSNTGKPLTTLEKAIVCKRLVGFGWSNKKISERFNFSSGYVNDLLNLLASPKAIRDMITDGTISATMAIETIKQHGHAAAENKLVEAKADAIAKGKKTVTAKDVKAKEKAKAVAGPSPRDLLKEIVNLIAVNPDAIAKNANGDLLRGWIEEAKVIVA